MTAAKDESKPQSKSEERRLAELKKDHQEGDDRQQPEKAPSERFFFPGDATTPSKVIYADSLEEAQIKYNETLEEKSNG